MMIGGVLEIKNTQSDQFSGDGRKQLLDWIDRGRTQEQMNYKGIFVGNSAVTKPVNKLQAIKERNPASDLLKKTWP
jgi:hypothetical protein